MSILDTTIVNQVIPFDEFPIPSTADRVIVPVANPVFLSTSELGFVPDGFGGFRVDPPSMVMHTYERTSIGWRRVQ